MRFAKLAEMFEGVVEERKQNGTSPLRSKSFRGWSSTARSSLQKSRSSRCIDKMHTECQNIASRFQRLMPGEEQRSVRNWRGPVHPGPVGNRSFRFDATLPIRRSSPAVIGNSRLFSNIRECPVVIVVKESGVRRLPILGPTPSPSFSIDIAADAGVPVCRLRSYEGYDEQTLDLNVFHCVAYERSGMGIVQMEFAELGLLL